MLGAAERTRTQWRPRGRLGRNGFAIAEVGGKNTTTTTTLRSHILDSPRTEIR
jgi:hypothetical protein